MNWIFWGMACMLLDIDVTLGGRTIGLVPDWLGWWWLAKGCTELETEWEGFHRSSIPKLMAGLALLLYGFAIMKLTVQQRFWLSVLALAATVAELVAARYLVRGIRKMEANHGTTLYSDKLQNLWLYLVILQVLKRLLGWVPLVGAGCAVAAFAMGLCWLVMLWKAKGQYLSVK